MSYTALYRKFRPTTFEEVKGQDHIVTTLRNQIKADKIGHAYLFCGTRGTGKTTVAKILARAVNCEHPTETGPCNQCPTCEAILKGTSRNVIEIDAASNNGVDNIREIREEVSYRPTEGRYKVYIIDEVHMLSSGAFNALLKTLEEPPSYAIFILATTEKHKVLPTILSRCQVYDFSRITVLDTIRHLQYVAKQEGINASEEALNVVAQKADGGMRDALSIFDQLVSFCGKTITYEQTIEVLNVLDTDYYFRLVDAALTQNVSAALLLLNEVLVKGFDAGHFVTGFAQHLRDVLVSKDAATVQLLETSDAIRQHYQEQATRCNAKWLFQALDIVNTCDINYRTARNKRLTVELALVKLCTLGINIQAPVQPTAPTHTSTAKSAPVNTASVPQPVPAKPASAPVDDVAKPIAKPAPKAPTPAPKPTMGTMPSLGSLGVINTNGVGQTNPNNSTASATTLTNSVKRNNPFTLDQLKSAWVGQIKNFQSEERFKAMLTTYDPEMDSENVFHITVANALQKKEFAKFGKQLMDAIRDTLQNDLLQLHVRVAEYTPSQMAYTASEKYKLLNEMNSHLGELRERMNLQLE